jgi:hypothetical protein
MKVELNIPKELENEAKKFIRSINLEKSLPEIISRGLEISFKEKLKREIAFKRLKKITSRSKLTDKDVLELGELVKEKVAKRLGLI